MSYRCGICAWKVPAGRKCLRHVVRRQVAEERSEPRGRPGSPEYWVKPVGSILREVKVCAKCKHRLDLGATVQQLEQLEDAKQVEAAKVLELPAINVAPSPLPKSKV